jgi:Apea-like HEPN
MNERIQSALKQAIRQSLPPLRALLVQCSEPYQVWIKQGEGSWRSEYQQIPAFNHVLFAANTQLNENGANFIKLFFEEYSEYCGMFGTAGFGMINLGHDQASILRALISRLWELYGTLDCNDTAINTVVEEFVQFVRHPTIKYRFQVPLLNFEMNGSTFTLPNNLIIRRLNEQEVSAFHGGSLTMVGINRSPTFNIQEFVIEGEDEAAKVFGDYPQDIENPLEKTKALLDKAVLCLRTFKEGPIGYNYIHYKPLNFFPFQPGTHGTVDVYVPFGRYELLDNEMASLYEYAELVLQVSESSMEMALSRLADAEIRVKPHDKIVDAVIGMEALLLAAVDSKTELKYRFSLHFSTLFHSPRDRHNAFRVAKDLYDLRSAIAHGSSLTKDKFRIGEEHLSLSEASKCATDTLRKVIRYFLPKIGKTTYKNHDFWERAYFNIENTSSNP